MALIIDAVNPLETQSWDNVVGSFDNCSFFHTEAWARVLVETYRYNPRYLTISEGNNLIAAIPFMEVDTIIAKRHGVSLPFSDYCSPLIREGVDADTIVSEINTYAETRRWYTWEIRGGNNMTATTPASAEYRQHDIVIDTDESIMKSRMRSSTFRNIKKAAKEGVRTEIATNRTALNEFVRLNGITRRHHGLPPQPKVFFDKLHTHIIEKKQGFYVLALTGNDVIAANVYFRFGDTLIYKYGASNQQFNHLRSNYAVMWDAARHGATLGCRTLSLGRTHPDNTGLLQFKDGWSADVSTLRYHRYDCRKHEFVTHHDSFTKSYNGVFRRMPLPIAQMIGTLAYRHMG